MLLFGVHIVDIDGVRRREQTFRRVPYLEPREALRRLLLRNSSFVREPAAVVRRTAIEREGLFDTTVGGAADTDMWVRLFSRYGVRCLPQATCAYTIHEGAATTGMWNPGTIQDADRIFDRAVARGIVPERMIRRWQADFLHQFILAGAYRRLRLGRRAEAREVLRLFELPEVSDRGVSPKWLPVSSYIEAPTSEDGRRAASSLGLTTRSSPRPARKRSHSRRAVTSRGRPRCRCGALHRTGTPPPRPTDDSLWSSFFRPSLAARRPTWHSIEDDPGATIVPRGADSVEKRDPAGERERHAGSGHRPQGLHRVGDGPGAAA